MCENLEALAIIAAEKILANKVWVKKKVSNLK